MVFFVGLSSRLDTVGWRKDQNLKLEDWEDNSEVQSTGCSYSGPEFHSQHTTAAYNHQFQGI